MDDADLHQPRDVALTDVRHGLAEVPQQRLDAAVGVLVAALDVEQHEIGANALAHLASFGGVLRQLDGVSFVVEDFREQVAYAQFVVDHQYVCHFFPENLSWGVLLCRNCE